MRVAMVRSDIGKLYTSDVESMVQRDFSAEPPGQSRDIYKPSDAAITTLLNQQAVISLVGGNSGVAGFNTAAGTGTILKIRASSTAAWTSITVTSGAAVSGVQIALDLNAGFKANGLPFKATYPGITANEMQIDTVAPNAGPKAYIGLEGTASGAALTDTVLGFTAGATTGVSLATFKAAAYVNTNTSGASATAGAYAIIAGVSDVLKIRTSTASPFTTITATAGGAVTAAQLAADLNKKFKAAGLAITASYDVTNHMIFTTVFPAAGPGSVVSIDTAANGSTLTNLLGSWTAGFVNAAATGVFVDSATLNKLGTWTSMQTAHQTTFYTAIRDLICPRFVETGPVLLSYVYGEFSKLRSQSFQPGGARIGLAAGPAAQFLVDDGSAVFTI
jgi:hypothetical protein